jgi:hypothetical protein
MLITRRSLSRVAALLDQGVSSLSNILALVLVARTLSEDEFGNFALSFTMLTVVLGLSRSYFGTRLSLTTDRDAVRGATSRLLGSLVILAPLAIVVVFFASLLGAGIESWRLLLIVAVATPVVCLQDLVRFGSIAEDRPGVALLSDSVWLAIIATPLVMRLTPSVVQVLALWFSAALISLAVALLSYRVFPRVPAGMSELRQRHRVGESVTYSILLGSMSFFLVLLIASRLIDPAAAGSLRGASAALGPISVLWSYAAIGLTPIVVKRARSQDREFSAVTGVAMAGLTAAWGIVLLSMPTDVGTSLFGVSWPGIRSVLPWTVVEYLVGCGAIGAMVALKARGCARQIVAAKVPSVVIMVGGALLLASVTRETWTIAATLLTAAAALTAGNWIALNADHRRAARQASIEGIDNSTERGG